MFIIQALKGKNDLWRYILGVFFVIVAYIVGQLPITFAALGAAMNQEDAMGDPEDMLATLDFGALGMNSNLVFFLLLLMFVCAILALYFVVTRLHKRKFITTWTSRKSMDWSRVLWAFALWMLFSIGLEVVSYFMDPGNYTVQFEPISFFILLLIALFILPIQTSFEEVFIRGYLLQGIGLGLNSRIAPLIITSLLFGGMHMMNPEVAEFGWTTMLTYYVVIALFLGVLALVDDGLELAIGVHTATNMYGALFVTFDGSAIQTASLMKMEEVDASALTIYSIAVCALFLFLAHKRYKFNWVNIPGPFIPQAWTEADDAIDKKDWTVERIDMEDGFTYQTQGLMSPSSFIQGGPLIDFEIRLDATRTSHSSFADVDKEEAEEAIRKMAEARMTPTVLESDKIKLSLDNGNILYLILRRNQVLENHEALPLWQGYLLEAFPVTPSFYETFNQKVQF